MRVRKRFSGLRIGLCSLAAATALVMTDRTDAEPTPTTPPGAKLFRQEAATSTTRTTDGARRAHAGAAEARVCRSRPVGGSPPDGPAQASPKRIVYLVRSGDSWPLIAERHGVTEEQLRGWNRKIERLRLRTELTLEVPPDFRPSTGVGLELDLDSTGLPLLPVPDHGESRGHPSMGRLLHGVQLPENPSLYIIRRPEVAYGSSQTIRTLQLAIAKFRANSEYDGPLVISDMSQRRGGKFAPHDSHQSGRDVDIWLPLRAELVDAYLEARAGDPADGTLNDWNLGARRPSDIDWSATLALVKAFARTAEVRYIFLSRRQQRRLYRTARDEGLPDAVLSELIEFPQRDRRALIRHAPRHGMHMHVRFRCGSDEPRCY